MADPAVPRGYHTVTPYLVVPGVADLIDFACHAFGGEVIERMERPDGGIMHAEVRIGDSPVMMGEPMDDAKSRPGMLYLYVDDCDHVYRRALEAGAVTVQEPTDQFYGDRSAGVQDPCGNFWWIATRRQQYSADELSRMARERSS